MIHIKTGLDPQNPVVVLWKVLSSSGFVQGWGSQVPNLYMVRFRAEYSAPPPGGQLHSGNDVILWVIGYFWESLVVYIVTAAHYGGALGPLLPIGRDVPLRISASPGVSTAE